MDKNITMMTVRDFFAGMALAGLIACTDEGDAYPSPDKAASRAFEYADRMIAEGKKS
jgi:hypothetical protein